MKKNKILIDANPIVPYFSGGRMYGIGRTCIELIQALNQIRDEIEIDVELYTQNVKGIKADNLKTRFKSRHIYLRNTSFCNRIVKNLRLREIISNYNLQHITHNYADISDPSRCILTIHDAMFFSCPDKHLGHDRDRIVIPSFAKKVRHIITISEQSKKDIMTYMDIPENKISIIPWGVDRTLFFPHESEGNRWTGKRKYFLGVSCGTGRKNTKALLEAFRTFLINEPEHHLILVWREPTPEALKLAMERGMKDRVHFASNISNYELSELYAGATATFFPSLYEGFGLPVLESMACGIPCVTSPLSSIPEVGGEAAIYVNPNDINSIASEMERFENNMHDLAELKQKCLHQASKFSWSKCARATAEVYMDQL